MARVQIPFPEKFLFCTQITVCIGDINYGNHLANDAALRLAHEARIRFLNHLDYSEMDVEGCGLIMVDASIMYQNEAFYADILDIYLTITQFSRAGFTMGYQIQNQKKCLEIARIQTGMVFFDYKNRKVLPTPIKFVEKVKQIQGEPL